MDILVIELPSVTIFWDDIGLANGRTMFRQGHEKMADFWDAEVLPWMDQHIKCDWNPHEAGIWFSDRHDALLFKLAWMGKFPSGE